MKEGLFKNKKSLIAIYEIEVTHYQYNRIKKIVKQIKEKNAGYNIIGLILAKFKIKLHRNKYYCSEFVYEVLSNENVHVIDNSIVLFKPEELIKNKKFNKIYEGKIRDFVLNL